MNPLKQKLEKLIDSSGARVSVVVLDQEGSPLVSINPHDVYHAASTIKTPILYTAISLWESNALSLDEKLVLHEAEKVGGSGILQLMGAGTDYSIKDLLSLMICISDNTATNMLIERLGIDPVNGHLASLGLENTYLARKLMISGTGTYSKTCALDMAKLFLALRDQPASLEILKNQQYNNRLNRDWFNCGKCGEFIGTENRCGTCDTWAGDVEPEPIPFYHKTGEIVGIVHDTGLIDLNGSFYGIAVLSSNHANNLTGENLLSTIGNNILDYLLSGGH